MTIVGVASSGQGTAYLGPVIVDSLNYDVFISYARRDDDKGLVSGLRDAVYDSFREFSSEPFRIFFD